MLREIDASFYTETDGMLDRLVHNVHKRALKGDSMRKARPTANRKDC